MLIRLNVERSGQLATTFFSGMSPELYPFTSKFLIICDKYCNSDLFGNMLYIWLVYGHADIALWAKVPNSGFMLNLYPYIVYASS